MRQTWIENLLLLLLKVILVNIWQHILIWLIVLILLEFKVLRSLGRTLRIWLLELCLIQRLLRKTEDLISRGLHYWVHIIGLLMSRLLILGELLILIHLKQSIMLMLVLWLLVLVLVYLLLLRLQGCLYNVLGWMLGRCRGKLGKLLLLLVMLGLVKIKKKLRVG